MKLLWRSGTRSWKNGRIRVNNKRICELHCPTNRNLEVVKINLRTMAVSNKLKEYSEIKSLICRAFPKNEQFPMWLLRTLAVRKSVDFSAYYDGESFCGISYTVNNDDLVFVLYLAVNDKIRSKGYGSAILQCIKQKYPNKVIALNIEPLEPNSDNYSQRVKRFEFYVRNGFIDTGCKITDNSGNYQILATTDKFQIAEYKSAIRKLSFGIYSPKVIPKATF